MGLLDLLRGVLLPSSPGPSRPSRRRLLRQARRYVKRLGPRGPIADVREGPCHVYGRARVLRGADGYEQLGAFLTWSNGAAQGGVDEDGEPLLHKVFHARQACGAFVVEDETGLALVDESEHFVVWGPEADNGLHGNASVEVRTGSRVAVAGLSRRVPLPPAAVPIERRGYRGSIEEGLAVIGTESRPVVILVD